MNVLIKRETGITVTNIPTRACDLLTNIISEDNSGLRAEVQRGRFADFIIQLRNAGFNVSHRSTQIGRAEVFNTPPQRVTTDPGPIGAGERVHRLHQEQREFAQHEFAGQTAERIHEPHPPVAPEAPAVQQAELGPAIDPDDLRRFNELTRDDEEDDREDLEDEVNAVPRIRNVSEQGSSMPELHKMILNGTTDEQKVKIAVAKNLRNQVSNHANHLANDIQNYSRLMSQLIMVKRNIERYSKIVDSNEVVSSIMSKIKEIKENNEAVEDIVFIDRFLIVKTHNIVTSKLKNGKQYDVGKLAFCIAMDSLLSEYTGMHPERPVTIVNLTREVDIWMCGHSRTSGQICYGTFEAPLIECFAKSDLESVIDLLLRFVRNPDIDDSWGTYIKYFPEYVEGEQKKSTEEEQDVKEETVAQV